MERDPTGKELGKTTAGSGSSMCKCPEAKGREGVIMFRQNKKASGVKQRAAKGRVVGGDALKCSARSWHELAPCVCSHSPCAHEYHTKP